MNRRKKRPQKKSSSKADVRQAGTGANSTENPAADATTVAWMLTIMATLVTELSAYAGWLFFARTANAKDWAAEFLALPSLLHFSAIITGCLGLILAYVVTRVRLIPTPRSVIVAAVAIGLLPIGATLLIALL